ncbi:MAG: hypothetical protein QOJ23_113 [Actinomycetota bacterium]|jgi:hypothetical protein|nr:hypothetical protein [Actinomycetota bacterium]
MLPRVLATRYVSPLREGGSLPGLVEADDLGTYVMKFTGAGQGRKALVAEVIVGELGRRLGLRIPEMAAIELDAAIGHYEADQEVQDLLTASVGLNLGIDFLPGAFGFDGVAHPADPGEAARILWFDAFVANIDRTWRNPNLLVWHRQLWCIDHGAALYFHHAWERTSPERFAAQPFDARNHMLIRHAAGVPDADAALAGRITAELLNDVVGQVPQEWLEPAPGRDKPDEVRASYVDHLLARLAPPRPWLPEETP